MEKSCIYQALQVITNENVVELILARKGVIAHESLVVRNSVPQSFLFRFNILFTASCDILW